MSKLTTLQDEIVRLQAEKSAIERADLQNKTLPRMRALIGNTYVYRQNSYGSEGYFDTFRKLVAVHSGEYNLTLVLEEVQVDSRGRPELSLEFDWVGYCGEGMFARGWKPCAADEYASIRERALRELVDPTEALAYLESGK